MVPAEGSGTFGQKRALDPPTALGEIEGSGNMNGVQGDSRVEVACGDPMDQLDKVAVFHGAGRVAHHQLLPVQEGHR